MKADWGELFDSWGVKTVTPTDRNKAAYVPSFQQCAALEAAGLMPAKTRPADPFQITIFLDPAVTVVTATYYDSRQLEDSRRPELRMGREFISSWAKPGDRIVIGNIGSQICALRELATDLLSSTAMTEAAAEIVRKIDPAVIMKRALAAHGEPDKTFRTRQDFKRNRYVVAGAILRANGKCQMPGCGHVLFTRDGGEPFLEVHHVIPLAEGGADELANAAALCPMCHRELHFGFDRLAKRNKLAGYVLSLPGSQ